MRHAHDRLIVNGDVDAATDLLCTTIAGARVLSARMCLTPGAVGAVPGSVLTLRETSPARDLSLTVEQEDAGWKARFSTR